MRLDWPFDPANSAQSAEAAGHAGMVIGIAVMLRQFPKTTARQRMLIPADILGSLGVTNEMIFAGDQLARDKIVIAIFEKELLHEDGMMVIEHSKYTKLDHLIHFSFKKSYGGSIFSFFEMNGENDIELSENEDFTEEE